MSPKTQMEKMEEKILMMKTLKALRETQVVIHPTEEEEDHLEAEVVEDHQTVVVVVEREEAQADCLLDHSNLQSLFKHHQEKESKSEPLTSLTETESEPRSSLTNFTCCSKETQTSTKPMMPKWLQQCPILRGPMSPGGGKTKSTTSDIMSRHGTSFKTSLVQSLL